MERKAGSRKRNQEYIQASGMQVPMEGILDEFGLFVTDFYNQLNETSETICYQEFGSSDLADIQKLRTLIGKRFYAVPYIENGKNIITW